MKLNIDDLGVVGIVVDDWAIEKSFKPKTITTDYNTWIVYISRKAVPANIPITNTEYWKPLTRLQTELAFDYNSFKEVMEKKMQDLTLQVETFLASISGGPAISDVFGDSSYKAVSQKAVTEAINKLWDKYEQLTGENTKGVKMTVSPKYFISEDGADIHITANTVTTNGIFEEIAFYFNAEEIPFYKEEKVTAVDFTQHINETVIVKCVAKILGESYTVQDIITKRPTFWVGAGEVYTDILDHEEYTHPVERGHYSVTFEENQYLFIVIDKNLEDGYIRADMNGFEIPMTRTEHTVNGVTLVEYKSINRYISGTYDIDING